jgi:hypothetical protein
MTDSERQFDMTVTFRIGALLLLVLLVTPFPAKAELYYWKDANGVRHYTNTKPPDGTEATVLMNEIPYDPETDDQRRRQEKAMLDEAEKEALQERLEEAERKADEARRQAEEAKRKADRLEEALEEQEEDEGDYRIYYPYPGHRPPGWRPPGHRPPGGRPPAWQPPRPEPRGTTPRKPRSEERRIPSQEQAD